MLRAQNFEWIDCPEFDVARHLRRVAIPRPGDDTQLSQAIAFALERPLDLNRPPWECWVIEGLTGNRWAILMKTHHDVADGNSAAHLLARLCDDAGGDAFTNNVGAQQVSSGPQRGWADVLGRAATVAGTLVGAMWPTERLPVHPVMRRYGTVRVPAADVDKVCRKFGVTVNDVALAAITEGFRRVLLRRGEEPRADSLRTLVPLFGRTVRSPMLPYLPVEHEDPVQQLRTVHKRWKAQQPQPGIVESALNCLPGLLRSNVLQVLARLPHAGLVTLGTHTPGPRHQLRLMGQTMERLLPIPPTATRLSTGVAVLSYGDDVVFGITAEYDAAADVKELAAGIELGMARMVALSGDSVLLFGREHRRRRAATRHPSQAPRAHPSARY
ncbi:diacylglycerol O-acyltransferase [Mycobacterium sp. E2699]|nr:diacylglycerol O-acyltransferase [Mycobacterium sp. E2699]OBI53243.1 diacylglycerol O-acyltransferase [Mycobacterium sp. E787]